MIDLYTTQKLLLTLDEFADILDVKRRTLYHWIAAGKLYTVKVFGSRRVPIREACRVAHVARVFPAGDGVLPRDGDVVTDPTTPRDPNSPFQFVKSPQTH